ncbi:hypothetical protein DPSP01_001972 [Paraphaeosphaeria sporulosa]
MAELPTEEQAKLAKENRSFEIIVIVSSFTIFAMIAVGLRLFTRLKITKMFGQEDVFIIFAMASAIALGGFQIKEAAWGNGRHQLFMDQTATEWMLIYLYCSIPTYNIALFFVRISILLQYRRIFVFSRGVWSANTFLMGVSAAFALESVFVGVFQCVPIDAFWDTKKMPAARCINVIAWYYANAGLNVAVDLLIAVLPVRAIWRLHIPAKQKVAVQLILTMGWVICIVSILRLHSLIVLGKHPEDISWHGAAPAYFSAIEVNLGIVCASLPALKPLIARVVPEFLMRQLSHLSRLTRTATSDHQSCMLSEDDHRWHAAIGDDLTPPSPLPPDQVFVTREFGRHSEINTNLGEVERTYHTG